MTDVNAESTAQAIRDLVRAETKVSRRSRLEQFIYTLACSWTTFPVERAAQAAVQLAGPMDIYSLNSFQSVVNLAQRLDLRPELEWQIYGFAPRATALPVILDDEQGNPVLYYLRHEVCAVNGGATPSPNSTDITNQATGHAQWRERRGHATTSDETTYANFHHSYCPDVARMLGNLWKIGAVAQWEDTRTDAASWAELPFPPSEGDLPSRDVSADDAWYHFRVGRQMGRDAFAEICLCLGNVFCNHLPQVWRHNSSAAMVTDPRLVSLEAECAGSIALTRLGGPKRRGASYFGDAITDDLTALPGEFRLDVVLTAASAIQDLLQGDTTAVVGAAWFAADDRGN